MKKVLKNTNEKGQSSVEYLLIVAVLVVAIFAFGDRLKTGLGDVTSKVFGDVGKALSNKIGQSENQ